jgi:hypothetical protein
MCPSGKAGEVKARIGEEGLVYMAGPPAVSYDETAAGSERALIFIGFEPGWGFEGLKRLDGRLAKPRPGVSCTLAKTESDVGQKRKSMMQDDVVEVKRQKTEQCDDKGSGKGDEKSGSVSRPGSSGDPKSKDIPPGGVTKERLLWMERARYVSLSKGYWLR